MQTNYFWNNCFSYHKKWQTLCCTQVQGYMSDFMSNFPLSCHRLASSSCDPLFVVRVNSWLAAETAASSAPLNRTSHISHLNILTCSSCHSCPANTTSHSWLETWPEQLTTRIPLSPPASCCTPITTPMLVWDASSVSQVVYHITTGRCTVTLHSNVRVKVTQQRHMRGAPPRPAGIGCASAAPVTMVTQANQPANR